MKTLAGLLVLALAVGATAAELPSRADVSLLKEVGRAQERGLAWLLTQQQKDGSWDHHPAITGLAVTAFLRSGKPLAVEEQEAVDRGVKFILTCVKPTGAIFGGGENDKYPNYSTAIGAMTLLATGKGEYTEVIRHARQFLLGSQFAEAEKIEPSDPRYGGIGYGSRQRPDLSNTSWALEALRLTESLETRASGAAQVGAKLHWEKAIAFLQRCQNLPAVNDQPWAKLATNRDLGGFVYMPGFSPANEGVTEANEHKEAKENVPLRSYGSMSYAGLKSYIYADLKKDDPRVVAAINWLKHNYTLDENPGMGPQGLYYYLHTMTKALTAYGTDTFTDAGGQVHDWRYEIMNKFVGLQRAPGFWQNQNNRWWENDPVLATTYSVLALEILQKRSYP